MCCGVGRLDGAAAALFWALDVAGAEGPMLLEGGFEAWAAGGRPKETTASKRPPVTWTASPRPDRVASAAYVALVFGADGHEVAAMFVQGSVTHNPEESTFIAVAEDGHPVGELFVDESVGYDENIDAFVIRTVR